jgi:hypothetical protein
MNAWNENRAAEGLRAWWRSSPRSGMQRLIAPWEYRHLGAFGVTRIAGGGIATAAGIVCLSYEVYGWAAFLPCCWGAESRGWLVGARHRSFGGPEGSI